MKNLLLILGCLLAAISCSGNKVVQPSTPVVVIPTPAPVVVAPPPVGGWKPGPIKSFQIFHFDGLADFKKKLKQVDVINVELEQIEEAGGKVVTDYAHSKGIKVVAYTSSGFEDFRNDADQFPEEAKGGKICKSDSCLTWWKGEKWGRPLTESFFAFHAKRAARAKSVNADGIEFDNTDWAWNKVGYTITKDQNLNAILRLVKIGHDQGLAVFAKNTPGLSKDLSPNVEGVFIEECNSYGECPDYSAYAGKMVAILEYSDKCYKSTWSVCNERSDYFE